MLSLKSAPVSVDSYDWSNREHHWVTVAQLKDYLQICHQRRAQGALPPALNEWLGRQAFFCGELVAVNLRYANLRGACFNGATLRHCQLGGDLKGAQFIGATWDYVTIIAGARLDDLCLDAAILRRTAFQTVTPLRLSMRATTVVQSNLAGLYVVGQPLFSHSVWDEASRNTLPPDLQARLSLSERQRLSDLAV